MPEWYTGKSGLVRSGQVKQSRKKTFFFVRYLDFKLKKVRILYFLNFVMIWKGNWIKTCFLLNFIHLKINFVINQQFCSLFYANWAKICSNYMKKYPGYLTKMSGILDTRILPFCNSEVKSGQVKSGQVKSGQVTSGQVKSVQIKLRQVKSGQVKSGQVKSWQVK